MFRIAGKTVFALIAAFGVFSIGIAGDAQAGSKHAYSASWGHKGGHYNAPARRGHPGARYSFAGKKPFAVIRGHARYGYRHPAASSGVMLGHQYRPLDKGRHHLSVRIYTGSGYAVPVRSGPKIIRFDEASGDWRDHYVSSGVTTGSVDGASAGDANIAGRFRLQGRACAPGIYCTVRLGRYTSSPKIITINASGRTITQDLAE